MTELDAILIGPLADFAGGLTVCNEDAGGTPCSELFEGDRIGLVLGRFGALYPGGSKQAVCVQWASWYFARLLPGSIGALLCSQRQLPLRADKTGIVLDEASQRPERIVVQHRGETCAFVPSQIFRWLEDGLRPVIAALSAHTGISPRVLWSEAAVLVDWTARCIGASEHVSAAARARAQCLQQSIAERGGGWRPHRFHQPMLYDGHGDAVRRSVCCLSYQLGGDRERCPVCPKIGMRRR